MFEVKIEDLSGSSQFKSEVRKVEREITLSLTNLNYETNLKRHQYLPNIIMEDMDKKRELPIYLIFIPK